MRRQRTPRRLTATAPRTRRREASPYPRALAFRSRERLSLDVLVLEVFQRAGMVWKFVCLVEIGRRELTQVRRDGDHVGLVGLHRLDHLVHHVVGYLA